MRFFVTTSKRAHDVSDLFARALAYFLPHAVFENRGRKTVDDVWARAMQLGKNAVAIVNEREDKPCEIQLLVFSEGDWDYGPNLAFDDLKFPKEKLKFEEPVGSIVGFDFGEEDGELVETEEIDEWICWKRGKSKICFKNFRWEK